ncbi:MAG: hypothetical protein M3O61_03635 [Gemmatimonadota bacterium]|nr:hypothetical protein [Gemmatimonadota bacterium]
MTDRRVDLSPGKWGVRVEGAIPTLGLDDSPPSEAYADHGSYSVWHLVYTDSVIREWVDLGRIAYPRSDVPGRFGVWILRDVYKRPFWEHLIDIDTYTQRWRQLAIRYFGKANAGAWDGLPEMTRDDPWTDILTTFPEFRETLLHVTDVCLARHPAPPIDTSHIRHPS